MTMRKVEIDNVEEMLEKTVTKDGKVGGLMKHAGKNVLIIVTKSENK
jgi:putative transposon-encoded protein